MTFNEINRSIYLHFTLNDIPLFMKSKKEADRVSKLVTTRNVDREAERIRRLIQMGEIQASDVDSEIEARMGEVFSENFSTVLDENQDSIDLDKYLLTAAYRIYRLIEILEDPNNRRKFPPFDTFKQYEKLYAESLIKINEELGDKEFDINYEATKGANPTGFWNELTQRCDSVEFSRQDLRELIESPLIQKVLNRVTFIGATALTLIAALPVVLTLCEVVPQSLALGGTGMIIVVGVALETMNQINGLLASNEHANVI